MADTQCNQSARVLTLQGQLIQEAVLAEELQKAEAQQQGRLQRLEVEAFPKYGELASRDSRGLAPVLPP